MQAGAKPTRVAEGEHGSPHSSAVRLCDDASGLKHGRQRLKQLQHHGLGLQGDGEVETEGA